MSGELLEKRTVIEKQKNRGIVERGSSEFKPLQGGVSRQSKIKFPRNNIN